jgi:hypothetical protein
MESKPSLLQAVVARVALVSHMRAPLSIACHTGCLGREKYFSSSSPRFGENSDPILVRELAQGGVIVAG